MAKYDAATDPYVDPASGVLRNKLGITTEHGLESAEAMYGAKGSRLWQRQPGAASYDLAHLQTIHRQLLGKVYDWAGEIRTVPIAKGGSQFAQPQFIVSAAKPIFAELARERPSLTKATPEQFAGRAAYYLGEVNALHPFREGNGRTQREFINQLAHDSGYHIRWAGISQQDMTTASIAAMRGDTGPMEKLLVANITEYGKEGMTMAKATESTYSDMAVSEPAKARGATTQPGAGNMIGHGKITEDQITQVVNTAGLKLEDAIPPAQTGEVAAAIYADRTKLDLMARSYAKDHPMQHDVGTARTYLSAIELAHTENRKGIELNQEYPVKGLHPVTAHERTLAPLRLIERTLEATDKAGMDVKHGLREEWKYDAMESHHMASKHGELDHG